MNLQLFQDAAERPVIFQWAGPIEPDALRTWLAERGVFVGPDLFELLSRTGGGDLFESETILRPFGGHSTGDNADDVNRFHHRRGMPEALWLFHIGLVLSAAEQPGGTIVVLSEEYEMERTCSSVEDWYRMIRDEYAERYGLPPISDRRDLASPSR